MGTSLCVWIVVLSAFWLADFIHSIPKETTIDCTTGTTENLGEVDEGYTGDLDNIVNITAGTGLQLEFPVCAQCEPFLKFRYITSITNATVETNTTLDAEALIETGGVLSYSITCTSTRVTNGRTIRVRDLNDNAPVFERTEYNANIAGTSEGEAVVQVKAVDADVSPINNRITYSLVATEHSSMFAVEPSSGKVSVVSAAGQSGNVTLQVMASDPYELNDTTTVKVVILESRDVVVISLNQEIGTVQNKTLEMKEALERALGWSVIIISVSNSRGGSTLSRTIEIHIFQKEDPPKTYVSFMATEINGTNVIPKETIQTKLVNDKEEVLGEMQQVFGPDVDFDVEPDDESFDITIPVIVGTVIAVVCIAGAIAAVYLRSKKLSSGQNKTDSNSMNTIKGTGDSDSMGGKPDFRTGDRDSMGGKPDFRTGDRDSMGGKPDFRTGDRDSMGGKPDFGTGDRDSMGGKPDFGTGDRDSMGGKPDFGTGDSDSMGGKPDF